MSEDTSYEYECMRAELLGVEKPSFDDYLQRREEKELELENVDIENLKDADLQNEDMKNASGGLYELGSILSATQKKLNRFKASCGSLTNLLKIKIGSASGSSESVAQSSGSKIETGVPNISKIEDIPSCDIGAKSDLSQALDGHVNKLDQLIEKAENCQYSMSQQNKQMKKILHQ